MKPLRIPSFAFLAFAMAGIGLCFAQQQPTPSAAPMPVVVQAVGRDTNQPRNESKENMVQSNPSEAGLRHVTLQLAWLNQFQFAGYYAAVEQGFYRDAGFDVTIVEGASGKRPIKEVVSGRANYGVAKAELLLSRMHGEPVVALAAIFQHSATIMLAKKESGINSPQGMIGKRVMLRPGDDAAEYLAMLKSEGVLLDKVRIIPTTYNIDDLIDGKTDVFNAYMTNEPYYLEQKGIPASIISPITYGIDFYGDCLFTSEQEIKNRPEQARAFRAASLRGWEYAMAHSEEMIDVIVGKYGAKKSRNHLRFEAKAMRKLLLPDLVEIGLMNPGRWRHMADTFVALGMADAGYSLEGFIYNPNPTPDYSWVPRVLGIGILIILLTSSAFFILLWFNNKLRSEVAHRRQAEEKLSRARDELELRVKERTAELTSTNEQLNIENAERRQAEEALRESEQRVRRKLEAILSPEADVGALELADIIDSDRLQKLMDAFYHLTRISSAIIDLDGRALVKTGWQDICTKFHRVNPESRLLCIESDLELTRNAPPGTFKQYRCKNNLWDMATPIMLGERQVGNIFLGQFLFDDDGPDYETFKLQAERYGFNQEEYLAALDRVPRWSRETVDAAMSFYAAFAVIIGNLSYSTIKLASALEERKHTEAALQRLNRELRAISDCNQVLVRAENEQALFDEICRIICEEAGYRMAWVGYPENDPKQSVRPVAWAGVEGDNLAAAEISWADTERGRGTVGVAVRYGRPDCIQDIATDPRMGPWRENALRNGYRSVIALPLKDENAGVFGVLVIYSAEPHAFTPNETRLMEELANDLAFGIQALRDRNARKAYEQRIELLSFALDNVNEAAFLIDEQARFYYVNEESCRMLGYSRDELLALVVADVDPDFPLAHWSEHWAELKDRRSLTFDGRHKTKDGLLFPVEISANYLEYEGQGYNLAMVRDISGRKRAEEALHRQAVELEREVAERQIAQDELALLNKSLEQRVRERAAELESKNTELERMNRFFVGRELRMVELKERIRELERSVGKEQQ